MAEVEKYSDIAGLEVEAQIGKLVKRPRQAVLVLPGRNSCLLMLMLTDWPRAWNVTARRGGPRERA